MVNLLIPGTYFPYHFNQPCDSVGRCPISSSPPNQTPNAVLIYQPCTHTHLMRCPLADAMQLCHCVFVPCHIYDECYMDNFIKHAYHQCILGNYIKHAYNSPTLTYSCQCITQTYINITYKSVLSQVMKHFIL